MDRIYFDQAQSLETKANGVEEMMAQAASMPMEQVQELVEDTRVQLNSLFHGPGAENVVFTAGVCSAQEQVLRAVLKKGDHVLVSPIENDTVMNTLNAMAGDVEYTILPCNDKGQLILFDETKGEKPFETIDRLVKDNTKVIILNHASEVCGTVLEVKAVSEYARKKGLFVIVNAAYTAAFVPIFMKLWGIDVLTFSGGYGLLASESIGGFIASENAKALLGGEDMRANFEQNPLDTAAVLGLHAAFDFIKETRLYTLSSVGQKRAEQFIRKVQHVNGLHIIGPGYNNRVPIVAVQTDFMDEADLVKELEEKYGIIANYGYQGAEQAHKSLGTWPRGVARFSFTYFNEETDIEKVTKALWQLTVHNDKDSDILRMPKE